MRIGTWNLAGRWTEQHRALMTDLDCDVWLLTEVSERLSMHGHELHLSQGLMAQRRRWASVLSRKPLVPTSDPHPASAMAQVDGLTICSSILPWRSCGSTFAWVGERHMDKTQATLRSSIAHCRLRACVGRRLEPRAVGREYIGSVGGRAHLLELLEGRGMRVPTAALPHHIGPLLSIDHIAHTSDLSVGRDSLQFKTRDGRRLSDHDGYLLTFPQIQGSSRRPTPRADTHGARLPRPCS